MTSQGTSNNHCAADTECKDGYTCIDDGTTNPAWCARFCAQDSQCTGTGSRCVLELTNAPTGINVCSNACDPYGQTGCPTGMGCLAFDAVAGDFTDCQYQGTKAIGQTCASDNECVIGSMCVTFNAIATCHKTCVVGGSTCPANQQCIGLVDALTIGTLTYGACN